MLCYSDVFVHKYVEGVEYVRERELLILLEPSLSLRYSSVRARQDLRLGYPSIGILTVNRVGYRKEGVDVSFAFLTASIFSSPSGKT